MTSSGDTPLWVWYLMRGSGLVALLLLSGTVALGVVGVKRWFSLRWPRMLTAGLHRNLPLLSVAFLAVHISTAVLDSFVGVGWIGVVLPFVSNYRPFWVGLGAVAFDLLVALLVTSLLRRRLGYRAWRALHWTAWLLWPVALSHALGAGTDAFGILGLSVCGVSTALVVAAACWRLRRPRPIKALDQSRQRSVPARTVVGDRYVSTPVWGAGSGL